MPKLDWVYFNNMFGNRIIEGATGSGSTTVDKEYPINIKESYVTDSNKECSAKCSFSFKYQTGSVSIKNVDSSHLELMYSSGRTAPVIFNGEKYNVSTIYIVTEPIHYFDGEDSNQVGEILIYHTSLEGALPLIVAIPLVRSYVGTTLGSSSLENIISIASDETAGAGDEVTVNNDNFTLNDYFPPKNTPFYSYQGNNFLGTSHFSGETVHYIVYKKDNGILLNDDPNKVTKLSKDLKLSFINDGLEDAFKDELRFILERFKESDLSSDLTDFYVLNSKVENPNKKIKYNNKILHQSKIINYFIQEKPSKKKTEKDLNNFLKKIKKSKKNYLITKDVIVIESLKFDGIEINEEYSDLYTINENTMPIDIQVLINDGEIGLAMLRIIEIIGEDELKNLGSETLYFLVNALNQMDIDLIRNEILSAILPVRV